MNFHCHSRKNFDIEIIHRPYLFDMLATETLN